VTRVQTRHARLESGNSGLKGMRLLITFAILALCSFAMVRGWNIVRFVDARAHVGIRETRVEEIRAWDKTPGLRDAALQASLTKIADMTDADGARKRADDLSNLLSIQPLSSVNWLSLAGMRLVAGQPEKQVLAALTMSWLTGPNEGSVMLQRGVFGLLLFEVLPADLRKRVIDDVTGAILGAVAHDSELTAAKNILSTKSVDIREEIASLMLGKSLSATQLARLGL
jgi:hypothetical protein